MPPPSKPNAVADQNARSNHGGKDTEEEETPSHNLWVGNLSNDTTDTELMDVFTKYGALDSVTTYASRNYAFVYFKRLEDAKSAKDALQGFIVRGNPIKIEFARPAKPGKHLWVGGISSSVTKEQLEEEFLKFGKIEDLKFLGDRNSALVDYLRLEDAAEALKSMNGKCLGGEQIRVDFLRSQPSRKENWSDSHESRDGHRRSTGSAEHSWIPPDSMKNFPRHQPSQQLGGRRGEGQPSNILWIGYPPSVQVDEQMLHNAMILFGEIERIKSFPSRHYSFVEFRSVDEARRAKEGLQGRLFNDPRIQILFSSSELAPGKDNPAFYPGIKGARLDMFFNEPSFGPGTGDIFGHNRPITPSNFPGSLPPIAMPGPNMMRPFGPQGGFDSLHSGPEFNDLAGPLHNFPDPNPNNSMGPNWRRLSPPASGMLPSPAPGMWPPIRPLPGTWDGFDTNPFQREAKRSRIDGPPTVDDAPFSVRKMDNQGIVEQPYGFGPQLDTGTPLANVQIQGRHSPAGVRIPIGEPPGQGLPEKDYCWRGIIAKGGTPVCHARCIPIGKGIDSQLPAVVNCSARTGLDMLAKHYSEASGFDIVFFLPDSEEDFASYTEFLRYLGSKNRAGVTKFDDGTTLFLVPPSDFLTKVLNVLGPERLYGVVLKLPQQMPSSASIQQPQQPNPSSQYVAGQQFPPLQTDYDLTPQKEDHMLQMDYSRASHGDLVTQPPKALLPTADESHLAQSVTQDYSRNPATASQVGVSLTPELIATLSALLPTSMPPSASTNAQLPLGSSASRPSFPASVTPDKAIQSQGWRSDPHGVGTGDFQQSGEDQTSHPSQQLGHQFSAQSQLLSQFPAYANASNGPDHSAQAILGGTQNQGPALHMPQQGVSSSKPLSNFVIPSQGGQYTIPQQASQQYQLDSSHNLLKSYGMVQGTNISQAQAPTSLVTDKADVEFPNQFQQLQSTLSGAGHGTPEGEADKNQRYQSTLQFAASLLLQIQQQQQQTNGQAVQGSGSHQ